MDLRVINKQNIVQKTIETRKSRLLESLKSQSNPVVAKSIEDFVLELENGKIPYSKFGKDYDLRKLTQESNDPKVVREFINTDQYSANFFTRQQYEIDAGRDMEPILYPAIYNVIVDENIDETISINTLGTTGIVFEEIKEGGEVKFATVGSGNKTIKQVHYGVGIEYSEDLFIYNQLWRLAPLERQFGNAHNALLNHVHMNPILAYSYAASNKTAAASNGTTLEEKYARTIDKAISHARDDKDNPRRGPYALLVAGADELFVKRVLDPVQQRTFNYQSTGADLITALVSYDGWKGTRGKKETTYGGVTSGKAYLVHLADRDMDFQSLFKHELRRKMGNPDASRFIMAQDIYDVRFGTFADPVRAVEEITWPTS